MALAERLLTRLFERGDKGSLNDSGRAIQVWVTEDLPEYWTLKLDARDACHERLRAAEKAGAVELTWSRQGGDDRTVDLVRLRDLQALAGVLQLKTTGSRVEEARACLSRWLETVPRVNEILDRWAAMKMVRGLAPEAAPSFADALQVLDALQARGEDQIVRRLGAELFRDSKRIETLERHLDILTSDSITAPAREWEEVFGGLGLVKEPQPFLIAGQGELRLVGDQRCPVVRPFVGVANKSLMGYSGQPAWILTVENLTTFHLCSQLPDARAGLIIFTGGMPSPSWCHAYRTIVTATPESTPAFHWGDIDAGGFRIAARLRECLDAGRAFHPWLMLATTLPGSIKPDAADKATLAQMRRHAKRAGWIGLEAALPGVCVEQELIPASLPLNASR